MRTRRALRQPGRWVSELTGDGPTVALLVLSGLNAVDELARVSFSVAAPTLADEFGVDLVGLTLPFGLALGAALALSVLLATLADRGHRVRLAVLGGVMFSAFSTLVGLSVSIWMLVVVLAGAQVARAFAESSHISLLNDYYPVASRPGVLSFYRAGNAVGVAAGGIAAGHLMEAFGWRAVFLVFAVPSLVLVLAGTTLEEPVRGRQEKQHAGVSGEVDLEEEPPSLAEAWRMCWQIDSLRRLYRTLPFLTPAVVGFGLLSTFMYRDLFGFDEAARGWVLALVEGPSQIVGLVVGGGLAIKLFGRDPTLVFGLMARAHLGMAAAAVVFAWAPNAAVAVAADFVLSACLACVLPGIFAALSLAIPPRARSTGFAMGSLFVLVGMLTVPLVIGVAGAWEMRWGVTIMAPIFVVGGVVIATAGDLLAADIEQVWRAAAARSEVLHERRRGRSTQLLVRDLDVGYGDVQVLFGVGLALDEREVVALLGTNGAGKSTLLKAICGLVPARKGTVILDGRDITYAPAHEIARRGVVLVPGGQSTFPSLTVRENLRVASWMDRGDRRLVAERIEEVLDTFPILRDRLSDPVADLSGGQQQVLGLAMAFLSRPRLVLIDELSLGLAPDVVEQLVGIVRRLRDQGTAVVVVEQSANLALRLARTAYFMEKGEIRFHGPTAELLDRPDLLRSVFLEGASATPLRIGGRDGEDGRSPGIAPAPGAGSRPAVAAADAEVVLELEGVTRSFGGIRAVDDVSLSLHDGEIVGIVGPNGAGKTTLFDLISGFVPVDAGTIRLHGRDVAHLPASGRARLGLGRSFQDARLFPALTVEQCIAVALDRWVDVRDPLRPALHLPAAFDAQQKVDERVAELVELLGLEAFRSKFVHELSTGSRRIVDLACLAAQRATVVLLDEPSSGIAQRETEALAPLLLLMRRHLGASLVVIEHDMPLISAIADRLVALDLGRTIARGTPGEVLRHPDVAASYLGSTPDLVEHAGHRAAGSEDQFHAIT